MIVTWGTWEELLLGGAVIRHGTGDWSVVAAELRGRTHSPSAITPEVIKILILYSTILFIYYNLLHIFLLYCKVNSNIIEY